MVRELLIDDQPDTIDVSRPTSDFMGAGRFRSLASSRSGKRALQADVSHPAMSVNLDA